MLAILTYLKYAPSAALRAPSTSSQKTEFLADPLKNQFKARSENSAIYSPSGRLARLLLAGDTPDQAMFNVKEVIVLWLEVAIDHGQAVRRLWLGSVLQHSTHGHTRSIAFSRNYAYCVHRFTRIT